MSEIDEPSHVDSTVAVLVVAVKVWGNCCEGICTAVYSSGSQTNGKSECYKNMINLPHRYSLFWRQAATKVATKAACFLAMALYSSELDRSAQLYFKKERQKSTYLHPSTFSSVAPNYSSAFTSRFIYVELEYML